VIVETARLQIRKLTADDAPFILEILNDAAFLAHIGDKNVRTLADAGDYIRKVPLASYARYGFGHYLVALKATSEPIGLCSLLKRDWLAEVDLGFAFLPAYRRQGYAYEAAEAVRDYAHRALGLARLAAIVSPRNTASVALLEKLGFANDGPVTPPDGVELTLFREAQAVAER
jgi:RimJ/RimL family protein N-acetyltransferase